MASSNSKCMYPYKVTVTNSEFTRKVALVAECFYGVIG